ncbi:ammonium transporter [Sphingopyxis panaciterrae]
MNKDVVGSFAWAGAIVIVALATSFARKSGYLDGDTVLRMVIGLNGLMIAWSGNRIPKAFVPSAAARQARRVTGWSMVLSGLVYAGLWAFAPIPVAVIGGCGAIVIGIAVTLGYCLSLRDKAKAA